MKTSYRREVVGRVSSMTYSTVSESCLVTTFGNGAFIFNNNKEIHETEHVEMFPSHIFDYDPLTSSCFLDERHSTVAVGSFNGGISLIDRTDRSPRQFYSSGRTDAVLSLQQVPKEPHSLLFATRAGAELVDLDKNISFLSLECPAPRTIAAAAVDTFTFIVANYDGAVMLYDSRVGAKVMGILSVPDQLASLSVCPNSGQACVGTVAGRVFTLRCREGTHREEAFGTGKHRSPIVNLSFQNSTIVAGDLGGRVSIIDTSNSATSTRYWSGESLLRPREYLSNTGKDAVNTAGERTVDIEVTAVAHGGADDVWTSFSTTKPLTSHIVSLPL